MATGDAELVEGNTWNDTYWGVCNGVGHNHLGKILMQVRQELQVKKDFEETYGYEPDISYCPYCDQMLIDDSICDNCGDVSGSHIGLKYYQKGYTIDNKGK